MLTEYQTAVGGHSKWGVGSLWQEDQKFRSCLTTEEVVNFEL